MATNEPEPDRATKRGVVAGQSEGSTADERDRVADAREAVADGRDVEADGRERAADDRDRVAGRRERVADARNARADDRDGSDRLVDEYAAAAGLRREQSIERDAAQRHRERASADRNDAETARSVAAAGRGRRFDEPLAVGAHLALNSSAIVVMGIGELKDRRRRISDPDRILIVDRVHHHAHAVDETLRRFITGEPV